MSKAMRVTQGSLPIVHVRVKHICVPGSVTREDEADVEVNEVTHL